MLVRLWIIMNIFHCWHASSGQADGSSFGCLLCIRAPLTYSAFFKNISPLSLPQTCTHSLLPSPYSLSAAFIRMVNWCFPLCSNESNELLLLEQSKNALICIVQEPYNQLLPFLNRVQWAKTGPLGTWAPTSVLGSTVGRHRIFCCSYSVQ